jgi:hypothetical protein
MDRPSDDTGYSVSLEDYVAAHLLTTEELEAIPSAPELLEQGESA